MEESATRWASEIADRLTYPSGDAETGTFERGFSALCLEMRVVLVKLVRVASWEACGWRGSETRG